MIKKNEKDRFLQGFSPFVIFGVVMILVPIFVFMTMDNIREQNGRTMEKLTGKGIFLIRAFEAGTRTGMMTMRWGGARVQSLLTETALQPEVEYMMITNSNGVILAHSNPEKVGQIYKDMPDIKKLNSDSLLWHRELLSDDGKKVFQVFKRFTPAHRRFRPGLPPRPVCIAGEDSDGNPCKNEHDPDSANVKEQHSKIAGTDPASKSTGNEKNEKSPDRSKWHSMEIDWFRMHFFPHGPYTGFVPEEQQNQIIFAALDMSEVDLAKEKYLKHVIAMGFMFFVLGSTGIMGILALQGYRSARTSISELKSEIERSRRLAAVGKLAAGVAHEIRNPLSSIKGFATYFRERYINVKDDREVADIMIQEVERLNRAVTQLLEFAKPLPVMAKEINIKELISHSVKLIEHDLTKKGIDVQISSRLKKDIIVTDPDRLNQILLNLYLNAMQAMEENGKLSVRLSEATRTTESNSRKKARSSESDTQSMVLLEVSDTGKGIDPKDIEHIFDPYFTNRPGGTGLGLAMVYRAIEALGAEITVDSTPGKGTSFFIKLPRRTDLDGLGLNSSANG